jgi:DNA polymerase elongation subunit (family B)
MFYTYVDRIGNRIFHRYSSDDGKRVNEVISSTPLELFIKSRRKTTHKSLFGDKLAKVDFSNISEMTEFVSSYSKVTDVFGQTEPAYQFISNTYPGVIKFDPIQIVVLNFDIEVISDIGFPDPRKAVHPITSITLKVMKGSDEYISFGYGDFNPRPGSQYYKCVDEKELLLRFISTWNRISPDAITGWNINGFDIPYCVNRIGKILGVEYIAQLSPFSKSMKEPVQEIKLAGINTGYKFLGITTLDYLELYKKYSYKNVEKYSLDFIAHLELGEKKVDYKEYGSLGNLFRQNFQLAMEYNVHDVELVEWLDDKLNFIFLAYTLAYIGKIRIHEIFGSVRFWDNYIYNALKDQGIVIPPTKHSGGKQIKGAFVKEPIPGLYKWIISFDLTSLYPSIIMSLNMSPETVRESATGDHVDEMIEMKRDNRTIVEKNYTIAANGAMFSKEEKGIMPVLVADMFKKRKDYKNRMLQAKKELEVLKEVESDLIEKKKEIATFDALQQAFKIALNSLYGAMANEFFRYYSSDISEGITLTGQLIIQFISKRINEFLNVELKTNGVDYVIAGDTDSIFITLDTLVQKVKLGKDKDKTITFLDKVAKEKLESFIASQYKELGEYLNLFENKLHMKREKLADAGIWRAKKNYIIQVYDNEGVRYNEPKISTVGVETSRSSSPEIVKMALKLCYKYMLNDQLGDLRNWEAEFRKSFFNADVELISFPRGISDLEKWKVSPDSWAWKLGAPIHVKAALSYNKLLVDTGLNLKMPLIRNGDKIKFIALKTANPIHNNAIAFFDSIPDEFGLDPYIDREAQYTNTFLNPLDSFLNIIGWQLKQKNTLDSLFGV